MRRSTLLAVMLPAFGATLLTALPARAAEYGAIAWDKQTGKRGWSSNQPTQNRADEAARPPTNFSWYVKQLTLGGRLSERLYVRQICTQGMMLTKRRLPSARRRFILATGQQWGAR